MDLPRADPRRLSEPSAGTAQAGQGRRRLRRRLSHGVLRQRQAALAGIVEKSACVRETDKSRSVESEGSRLGAGCLRLLLI